MLVNVTLGAFILQCYESYELPVTSLNNFNSRPCCKKYFSLLGDFLRLIFPEGVEVTLT